MGTYIRDIFTPRLEVEPAALIDMNTPVALLVDIIQHQDKKISDLENRIAKLENNKALNIHDL